MIRQEHCLIISHQEIAENIFELILQGDIVKEMNEPGQFVHVKVGDTFDPLLRRPLSIAHINKNKGQFTLIYRVSGKGTELLSKKSKGDVVDILGPLGNGFPVHKVHPTEVALLVGGGIGIPPLFELAKQLNERGIKIVSILGAKSKSVVFYEEKFQQYGKTYIVTEDGSYGEKGLVTHCIEKNEIQFDYLFSCGPIPMLKSLTSFALEKKVYISLENRMACGIGACLACVCPSSNQSYKKICSDGPVFLAEEVML